MFPFIIKNQDNQRKYRAKRSKAQWKKLSTHWSSFASCNVKSWPPMTPNYQCWISTHNPGQASVDLPGSHQIPPNLTSSALLAASTSRKAFSWRKRFQTPTQKPSSKRYPEIKTQHCHHTHQKSRNFDRVVIMKDIWKTSVPFFLPVKVQVLLSSPGRHQGTLHRHVAPRLWQLQQRISSRSAATALIASWTCCNSSASWRSNGFPCKSNDYWTYQGDGLLDAHKMF